jgi:DNA-binding HxlR family transcriptional regulator
MRYSEQLCPRYQRAIELLGKRWTGLILKVLLEGPLRFNEIAERLEVVSDRMLAERLRELETEGVIERHVYPEIPVRVEYRLTEKGLALAPVIEAIERWSTQWVALEPASVK